MIEELLDEIDEQDIAPGLSIRVREKLVSGKILKVDLVRQKQKLMTFYDRKILSREDALKRRDIARENLAVSDPDAFA